jgi:hypothetical protein
MDGEVNVAFLAWVLLPFGNKTNNVARLAMMACCGSTTEYLQEYPIFFS